MASQDARLSKFEADFKQQQSEMTNKIDIVLKAITDRLTGALPSDTVKNPKMNTSTVLSARSYPNMDPQCSNHIHGSINVVTIHSEQQSDSYDEKAKENEEEENDSPKNIRSSIIQHRGRLHKGNNGEVMFIEIIRKNDDSSKEEPEEEGSTTTEGVGAEYFDIFPTRSELAYHKYLMCGPIPSIFLRNPIIKERKKLVSSMGGYTQLVHVVKTSFARLQNHINSMSGYTQLDVETSTWMTFGGNTRDLGSFEEETDEITDLLQDSPRIMFLERRDGVTSTKRRRHDLFGDNVRDLAMAS
ncbi:hypothetical protein Tco_1345696 [Tanacetum coccineum]